MAAGSAGDGEIGASSHEVFDAQRIERDDLADVLVIASADNAVSNGKIDT